MVKSLTKLYSYIILIISYVESEQNGDALIRNRSKEDKIGYTTN